MTPLIQPHRCGATAPRAFSSPAAWCLAIAIAIAAVLASALPSHARADELSPVGQEIAAYLDFAEYGGGTISAEQIPAASYAEAVFIDTRDAVQYAKAHIPNAINIEWRRVLEEAAQIPKNKMVVVYCNTGLLSAQAGFALRVAGWDNVRILQGGYDEWLQKGGVNANANANANAKAAADR